AGANGAWWRPVRSTKPRYAIWPKRPPRPKMLLPGRLRPVPVCRPGMAAPRSAFSPIPEGPDMRVAIIDYGSGNLRSATRAFERAAREAGIDAAIELTADASRVGTADRIVLPGVGAYADCRAGLAAVPGMDAALDEAVI